MTFAIRIGVTFFFEIDYLDFKQDAPHSQSTEIITTYILKTSLRVFPYRYVIPTG